jgi:endonuclease/exonuclease/phosphatase (EEP) superfamily protein YafD
MILSRMICVLAGFAFSLPLGVYAQDIQAELPHENEILVRYGSTPQIAFDADKPLRVFNWNVHKFDNQQTFDSVQKISNKADVILVQESMMEPQTENLFGRLLHGFETLGAISFYTQGAIGTGVSTSSRAHAQYVLPIRSREVEPVVNTPKMVLIKVYKLIGRQDTLAVANIHGLNFVPNWKFGVQLDQLEAALADHVGPVVLAGDFNTHNVEKAQLVRAMTQRLGLQYVWMKNTPGGRVQLDHMFVRGLKPKVALVLTDWRSSDHFPLWAELDFLNPE